MLLHIPSHVRKMPLYFFMRKNGIRGFLFFRINMPGMFSIPKIISMEPGFFGHAIACPYVHRWFYIHALLWQGMTDRSDRLPIPQSFILWRICRVCCILNRKTDVSLGGFLNLLWHVPTSQAYGCLCLAMARHDWQIQVASWSHEILHCKFGLWPDPVFWSKKKFGPGHQERWCFFHQVLGLLMIYFFIDQ